MLVQPHHNALDVAHLGEDLGGVSKRVRRLEERGGRVASKGEAWQVAFFGMELAII